jgi:hypothetical protein
LALAPSFELEFRGAAAIDQHDQGYFALTTRTQMSGQNIPINAPMVRIETTISSHELTR